MKLPSFSRVILPVLAVIGIIAIVGFVMLGKKKALGDAGKAASQPVNFE